MVTRRGTGEHRAREAAPFVRVLDLVLYALRTWPRRVLAAVERSEILEFLLIPARAVLGMIEDAAAERAAKEYDHYVNRLGWDPKCYRDDRNRMLHPSSSHPRARPHLHIPHVHMH